MKNPSTASIYQEPSVKLTIEH